MKKKILLTGGTRFDWKKFRKFLRKKYFVKSIGSEIDLKMK